jgi:DNA-binding winged helix-turn-helix (wHTH) protein
LIGTVGLGSLGRIKGLSGFLSMRISFGDCLFDSELRQLHRGGAPVHMTPKGLRLLELLLERRPRPVSKQEIRDAVWPSTAVAEGSLANLVFEVRTALGDDPREPTFVRTVHGFGYSFCGQAAETAAPGAAEALSTGVVLTSHRLVAPGGEFDLDEGENLIGRDSDCAVRIRSTTVSRHHARILVRGDEVLVEDLGSKNGTFLSGVRVEKPTPLKDGDALQIGSIRATYHSLGPETSTDTFRMTLKGH